MSEKILKTRIQNKRGTTAEWATGTAPNFVPLDGELVIYKDVNKIKIGDGITKVGDLSFVASNGLDALVFNGSILVSTVPSVGQTFSYGPTTSFNRTPAVGDNFIALIGYKSIVDDYLCQCRITAVNSPSFTATYVNVTKATGKDGTGVGDIINFTLGKTTSVTYNTTDGAHFIGQSSFTDKNGNTSNQTSSTTLPIRGGNGITVGAASDNKFLEVKVGDTIVVPSESALTIAAYNEVEPSPFITFDYVNSAIDFPNSGATWLTVNGYSATAYTDDELGGYITAMGGCALGSTSNVTTWIPMYPEYKIDATASASNGTLPDGVSYNYLCQNPEKLKILFNKEYYTLADNQHTANTLVFSHVGYEDSKLVVKIITITIPTRAWVLTTTYPGDGKVKDVTLDGESIVNSQGVVELHPTVMTDGYVPVWDNTEKVFKDGYNRNNVVTTDTAQTISGKKTFGGEPPVFDTGFTATAGATFDADATFNTELDLNCPIRANNSLGTSGQVLISQGSGNSPKWGDVPAPSNVVMTDTEQAISGVKRFVSNSSQYPQTIISSSGMGIQSSQDDTTVYSTSIMKISSGSPTTINLPSSSGTLALTSDIPIKTATLSGTTLSITLG